MQRLMIGTAKPSILGRIVLQFNLVQFDALSLSFLGCVEYLVNHIVDLILRNRCLASHFLREQLS
jgi:hypothetical protein